MNQGTIINMILEKYPEYFQKSISYTTRNAQPNETHGVEYFFVSKEEFEKVTLKAYFKKYLTI